MAADRCPALNGLRTQLQSGNDVEEASNPGDSNMKPRNRMAAVLAAFTLAIAGCAASGTHESTGQFVDDATITTKVKTAIFNDPNLKTNEIGVETYKGVVQLSGFVSSQSDINRAAQVARTVNGVKTVKNDLHVR
jgi:osmotically-inducible protein OsmY